MDWDLLKERLRLSAGGRMGAFAWPAVILEIEPDFVAGARLESSARPPRRVLRMALEELEPRSLVPVPNRPNIANEAELRRALSAVVEVVGNGSDRLGLVVPDGTVRVGILAFETLPRDPREVEALVRWRMRENLPFAPEEARLSYQAAGHGPGGAEVLAVAVKSSVLAEYELALEQMNGGPVLILPATMTLLPLLPEADGTGQLLVHVCSGWVTTVVVEGSRLRSWRTRELGRTGPGDQPGDVASEAARVLASSHDRLKVEIGRVWLCARPPATPELERELARAISREVELLVSGAELAAALPTAERTLFERFGATVAGVVSNSG